MQQELLEVQRHIFLRQGDLACRGQYRALFSVWFMPQSDLLRFIRQHPPPIVVWIFSLMTLSYGKFFLATNTGNVTGIVNIWIVGEIKHGTPLW